MAAANEEDFIANPTAGATDPNDSTIPPDQPPTDPGDGVVDNPELDVGIDDGATDPTDPGDPTEPPPTDTGIDPPGTSVPDYSGEADNQEGGIDLDYNMPETPPDVPPPLDSGTADPTMTPWNVTPEQTVQGQLEQLYDRDSPFFETARQRAIRGHLGAGGQNSAMAGQMGELAALDKAFQVAQQDAATYARSAEFNASMANQFSLAEQRFIHNALLSDQAYQQARNLQTQRIEAQFESIILDYKGRGQLMDKELDQWFLKAKQDYAYQLGLVDKQTDATLRVNSMQALSNFFIASFQSVMEAANNPNLTPEQSAAAMREGMAWASQQWQFLANFLGGYGNAGGGGTGGGGSTTGQNFIPDPNYNWMTGGNTNSNGSSVPTGSNGYPNWADYSTSWQNFYNGSGQPVYQGPYAFGNQGWGFLGGTTTG